MTTKTTFHAYQFDLNNPEDKAAWNVLQDRLQARGSKVFQSWGGRPHYQPELDGRTLELDTKHIFDNQWNAIPGGRVFDWARDYLPKSNMLVRGHYLDLTDEMTALRDRTFSCGYCGHYAPWPDYAFCPKCIGSKYLTPEGFSLTRMWPVSDGKRPGITPEEKAERLALWQDARVNSPAAKDRATKRLAALDAKVRAAQREREVMTWVIRAGLDDSNAIYYSHIDELVFGWRNPFDADQLARTIKDHGEPPAPYSVKQAK